MNSRKLLARQGDRDDHRFRLVRGYEGSVAASKRALPVAFLLIFLSACGSPYRTGEPAPVVSRGEVTESRTVTSGATSPREPVEVRSYKPPTQVALVRPATPSSRAVKNLLQRAEAQSEAGDYPAAQASLERALRIEPGSAHLWNRLARLHLLQQSYSRAEQFASKSNSLAQGDDALSFDNWSVIAQARRARGDSRGAQEASERARVMR